MLYSCVVDICVSILGERTYFEILGSINKGLLKSALISTITKQGQSFGTYSKNINGDGDASRLVYKMDYLS